MQSEHIQMARDLALADTPDGVTQLGLGEAVVLRRSLTSDIEGTLYRPLLCLILKGAKEVSAGSMSVLCPTGNAIIVSHDLPVLSRITKASPALYRLRAAPRSRPPARLLRPHARLPR